MNPSRHNSLSPRHDVLMPLLPSGPRCNRSRLPPWLRLSTTSFVLFGLKAALPHLGLEAATQVFVLLIVATLLVWRFWWTCVTDRRRPLLLIGSLWIAGMAKLLLQ